MAEVVLAVVCESVARHLVSLASSEIGQAYGVGSELKKLKSTVSAISAVLREAEKCQVEDEGVKDWLEKLRDVVYDADDLLDDLSSEALRRLAMGGHRILQEVGIFFSSSSQIFYSFEMAHRVKDIRERLDAIKGEKSDFEFKGSAALETLENRVRRDSYPYVRASHVIGREEDKERIINFLLDPNFEECVPIQGVGGLGKTTLAKLVFNDERIKTYFKLKLWVCVSMNFDVENIVRKIVREITPESDLGSLNMNELQKRLADNLEGKKFLLVLDDVWNGNKSTWMELQDLLMDGAKGSKILL